MSSPVNVSINLNDVSGALFVGFMFSIALHGWLLSQTWAYFRRCHQDNRLVMSFVAILCLLETCGTVGIAQGFYDSFITNFGSFVSLVNIPIGFKLYYVCTPISIFLVQLFFVYRLYRVSEGSLHETSLTLVALLAALSALALGLIPAAAAIRFSSLQALNTHFYTRVTAAMSGLSALCDVIITWALCGRIFSLRNGFASTERTIMTIGSYVLNRGIVLLLVQTAAFVSLLIDSKLHPFLFFEVVLAKLYTNSLVSFLVSFEPNKLRLRGAAASSMGVLGDTIRSDGTVRSVQLEVKSSRETHEDLEGGLVIKELYHK